MTRKYYIIGTLLTAAVLVASCCLSPNCQTSSLRIGTCEARPTTTARSGRFS